MANQDTLPEEGTISFKMPPFREGTMSLKCEIPQLKSELKLEMTLRQKKRAIERTDYLVGWASFKTGKKEKSPLYVDLGDKDIVRHEQDLQLIDINEIDDNLQVPSDIDIEIQRGRQEFLDNLLQSMENGNADRYKGKISFEPRGSYPAGLRVGKPYELDYAIEFKEFMPNINTMISYSKCYDASSDVSDVGTHFYFLHTNLAHWNHVDSKGYFKLKSKDFLQMVQIDTLGFRVKAPTGWILHDIQKHSRGLCAVLSFHMNGAEHGVLMDLVPIIPLNPDTFFTNERQSVGERHKPNQSARDMAKQFNLNLDNVDLELLNEEDDPSNQLDGAWSLSSAKREFELLKVLPNEVKSGFRIVKFINQHYILKNSPEIDPSSTHVNNLTTEKSLQLYGMKSEIKSRIFQVLLINILAYLFAIETHIGGPKLAYRLLYVLYKVLKFGHQSEFRFQIERTIEKGSAISFGVSNYKKILDFLEPILEIPVYSLTTLTMTHPVINYPLKEHAQLIDVQELSTRELISSSGKGCDLNKDEIACHPNEVEDQLRTVFLKQRLDQSWVIKVKVVELGKCNERPFIIGIVHTDFQEQDYFENPNLDILQSAKSFKDLNKKDWLEPKNGGINIGSIIEIAWNKSETKGRLAIKIKYAFQKTPTTGILDNDVNEGYTAFMILPSGMKIKCEATRAPLQSPNWRDEERKKEETELLKQKIRELEEEKSRDEIPRLEEEEKINQMENIRKLEEEWNRERTEEEIKSLKQKIRELEEQVRREVIRRLEEDQERLNQIEMIRKLEEERYREEKQRCEREKELQEEIIKLQKALAEKEAQLAPVPTSVACQADNSSKCIILMFRHKCDKVGVSNCCSDFTMGYSYGKTPSQQGCLSSSGLKYFEEDAKVLTRLGSDFKLKTCHYIVCVNCLSERLYMWAKVACRNNHRVQIIDESNGKELMNIDCSGSFRVFLYIEPNDTEPKIISE